MFEINRYDRLQAKAKKLRNKTDNKTIKANKATNTRENKIKKLRGQILEINYKKNVYIENVNRKLKDVNSLIANEQNRIIEDKKQTENLD